jgi:hypothetical protein
MVASLVASRQTEHLREHYKQTSQCDRCGEEPHGGTVLQTEIEVGRGGKTLFVVALYRSSLARGPGDLYLHHQPNNSPNKSQYILLEAAYTERDSNKKLFLPLRPIGAPTDEKAHVIFESSDPKLVSLLEQMLAIDKAADESKLIEFIASHPEIQKAGSFEGLVRFGYELKSTDTEQLAALEKNLADDFIIMVDGRRPEIGIPLTTLLLGLGLGIYLLVQWLREKTGRPIVILGTKRPSITSTWMTSAPPSSTADLVS